MKIGIIGAGKVGCSIGKYLSEYLTGFYSRTKASAQEAAQFTGSQAFEDLETLMEASDTLMIATPDGEIGNVWDCIAAVRKKKGFQKEDRKIACHFSGSLSSDIFSNRESYEVYACSLHPMYAFSDKYSSYLQLNQAVFTVEGDSVAAEQVGNLFLQKGNQVCRMKSEYKMKYHAAAAMLSNHMIALIHMGKKLLTECGFEENEADIVSNPLILANVKSALEHGCMNALTGPVERNDVTTVEKHLKVLDGKALEVYQLLSKELVELAMEKHPERDYQNLSEQIEKKG